MHPDAPVFFALEAVALRRSGSKAQSRETDRMTDTATFSAQRVRLPVPGGALAALAWRRPGAPRALFVHANGFCATAYRRLLTPLADHFDILAPDLRGHGRTDLPAVPATHHSWNLYAEDLAGLIRAQTAEAGAAPDLLIGHSMGATSLTLAAAKLAAGAPDAPRPRLLLIEPVVLPRLVSWMSASPLRILNRDRIPIARTARRRTPAWADRDAPLKRYSSRPPFSRWAEGVVADYLEDGLRETEDGGVALSCAPAWEAANFEAQGHDLDAALRRVGRDAVVFRAEHASTVINSAMLDRRGVAVRRLAGLSHLAPMEDPEGVAARLLAEAQAV